MLAKLPVTRQALLDAADLIEAGGLAKERFQIGDAYCVRGAICQKLTGDSDPWFGNSDVSKPSEELLTNYLVNKKGFIPKGSDQNTQHLYCAEWNNEEERTQEEVVDALREAALYGL